MGYWCQLNIPSQFNIPTGISIAIKIDIEAAQGSEKLDHVLRCKLGQQYRRKMNRLFQQTGGIALNRASLGGCLPSKFRLNLRSNVECDGHGHLPLAVMPLS